MHTEFWWKNILENVWLEDRRSDARITLRYILGRQVMRMGDIVTGSGSCLKAI